MKKIVLILIGFCAIGLCAWEAQAAIPNQIHVNMGGLASPLTIPSTSCFTMRAVESIIIDGSFVLPVGAQMTLMTHQCPQCSMENVELPSYDCGMDTTKDE